MGTAVLTCSYWIPETTTLPDTVYIAEGNFSFSPNFALVSGDSAWIDTVRVNEHRTHKVTVRALVRGDWLVDAGVHSVVEPDVWVIGGGRSIELHVR